MVTNRSIGLKLGVGALLAACLLYFYAIPTWVRSPSNVREIVMSPVFWPTVLSGLMALTGIGLVAGALRGGEIDTPDDEEAAPPGGPAAWARLGGMAAIMVLTMFLLPRLGMVWTSMLVFAATAFLMGTRYRVLAVVCAVLLPLALYGFFAHVAGVAIPQGNFVRLP
ncbi:tripartite tricarboxylate transporter TctB family protein [Halovulum dunhuangense]|uniref:Tripartite tricarboxylate transporter TctB family protein n=1 Tax=Halovulum dunhuangense TaxID=1505036 RepID=A0A849L449_9RHOB|nr:tripartite tricarboxylate transporter TctB family protein [Halovulum dunhuangense]NNU80972.1 tripartite tricarboxylate transporter TctB family protein [Halovulum dunhuangense]